MAAEEKKLNAGPEAASDAEEKENNGRPWWVWGAVGLIALAAVFLIGLFGTLGLVIAGRADDAANWVSILRDVFIIVLAMQGMLLMLALVVLILQIAALLNVLQNEIKPIVENAQETVSTVRGTTQFMSQNLVEPVIRAGAWGAAISAGMRELMGIRRALRRQKNTPSAGDGASDAQD